MKMNIVCLHVILSLLIVNSVTSQVFSTSGPCTVNVDQAYCLVTPTECNRALLQIYQSYPPAYQSLLTNDMAGRVSRLRTEYDKLAADVNMKMILTLVSLSMLGVCLIALIIPAFTICRLKRVSGERSAVLKQLKKKID